MRPWVFVGLVLLGAVAGFASISRGYCARMQMEAAQARERAYAQMMYRQMMVEQRAYYGTYSSGASYGPFSARASARREAAASRAKPGKAEKRHKNLEWQYNRAQGFEPGQREAKAQSLYNQAVGYEKMGPRMLDPTKDYYTYASRLSPDGEAGMKARAALARLDGDRKTLEGSNRAQKQPDGVRAVNDLGDRS